MDQQVTFFIILGMAVVTYLPRLFPVWFLSSRDLPGVVIVWLKYIPAAVLAALLLPLWWSPITGWIWGWIIFSCWPRCPRCW